MFDIGWSELMLIAIVALIVVGPKELPGLFRTVGRFMGKARGMAREFQRSMEQAADESGLGEASKSLNALNRLNLNSPTGSARKYAEGLMSEKPKAGEAKPADKPSVPAGSEAKAEMPVATAQPAMAGKTAAPENSPAGSSPAEAAPAGKAATKAASPRKASPKKASGEAASPRKSPATKAPAEAAPREAAPADTARADAAPDASKP